MGNLQARYPSLDVRISASNQLIDLRAGGIDLAVRYCRQAAAPAHAVHLFGETVLPVAHPSLRADLGDAALALTRVPLLDFDDTRPWLRWRTWLSERAWRQAKKRGILQFNQYDQVIQAALAGQGVALGRMELIQPLIEGGHLVLVRSPPPYVASPNSYWLIQAEESPRADVARVAEWIRSEASAVPRIAHKDPLAAGMSLL